MQDSQDPVSRIWSVLKEGEVIRAVTSAVVMIILAATGFSLWLALPLGILLYVGLTLLSPAANTKRPRTSRRIGIRIPDLGDRIAYGSCKGLHKSLKALSPRVKDDALSILLASFERRFEDILAVIKEDDKYEASPLLKDLVEPPIKLLEHYDLVVLQRGFTEEVSIEEMRATYTNSRRRCEKFWTELNRAEIVNLKTLKEILDEEMESDTPQSPVPGFGSAIEVEGVPSLDPDEAADPETIRKAEERAGKSASSNGHHSKLELLTSQELKVTFLISRGKSSKEIAEILFISTGTSNKHTGSSMRKINVKSRTELAVYAIEHGIKDDWNLFDGVP